MKKSYFVNALLIALVVLGTFFLCRSLHAETLNWQQEYNIAIVNGSDRFKKKSAEELRDEWTKELEFHKANAIRCYEDAKDRCWWLPEIPDREKARYCYTSAFAALGNSWIINLKLKCNFSITSRNHISYITSRPKTKAYTTVNSRYNGVILYNMTRLASLLLNPFILYFYS